LGLIERSKIDEVHNISLPPEGGREKEAASPFEGEAERGQNFLTFPERGKRGKVKGE